MVISDGFFSSNILQIYDTRFKLSNSKPESQARVFSLINVFIFISFLIILSIRHSLFPSAHLERRGICQSHLIQYLLYLTAS